MFVAITEKVGVTVRLAKKDEYEFRLALEQGGMRRVESALASLDAQKASAMVPSDRTMIMEAIETSVGLDEFNRLVREKMLDEFKRAAIQSTMR